MQASVYFGMALVLSAPALKEPPKLDPRLVGKWVLESACYDGEDASFNRGLRFYFTDLGRWTRVTSGGGKTTGTLVAPPSAPKSTPATFDWIVDVVREAEEKRTILPDDVFRPRPVAELGIYQVEEDMLTMCLAFRGKDRPTGFARDQKGVTILILRRFKLDD
jgi:uncharacterized protein (TIGR03067 family)